jgi:hypothetical protein
MLLLGEGVCGFLVPKAITKALCGSHSPLGAFLAQCMPRGTEVLTGARRDSGEWGYVYPRDY